MEKKRTLLSLLPAGLFMLNGCAVSTTPDVAASLQLQCGANPQKDIANQTVEMAPEQKIKIGNISFLLTEQGRLKFKGMPVDVVELGPGYTIIKGDQPYFKNKYLVTLEQLEEGNKTLINVSMNCKNPTEER